MREREKGRVVEEYGEDRGVVGGELSEEREELGGSMRSEEGTTRCGCGGIESMLPVGTEEEVAHHLGPSQFLPFPPPSLRAPISPSISPKTPLSLPSTASSPPYLTSPVYYHAAVGTPYTPAAIQRAGRCCRVLLGPFQQRWRSWQRRRLRRKRSGSV
jgi:hypothetical protein